MTELEPLPTFRRITRFQSMDFGRFGIPHFDAYVRMMEETEYDFLRSRGLSVVLPDDRGVIGFPRLSTDLQVFRWIVDPRELQIELQLARIDGKQIEYRFEILDRSTDTEPVATGRFTVACCRFPGDRLPYAILIPDDVVRKLTAAHPISSARVETMSDRDPND